MKLNTNKVRIISAVISFALVGLIWVQIALLKRAYTLELRSFEHNVNSAISVIVQKLENHEILNTMVEIYLEDGDRALTLNRMLGRTMTSMDTSAALSVYALREDGTSRGDSLNQGREDSLKVRYTAFPAHPEHAGLPGIDIKGREMDVRLDEPAQVTVVITDSSGQETRELMNTRQGSGSRVYDLGQEFDKNTGGFLKVIIDSTVRYLRPLGESPSGDAAPPVKNARKMLISTVSSVFDSTGTPPLLERIDPAFLDSVITVTLEDAGLPRDVEYAVYSHSPDSLILKKPLSVSPQIKESAFKARLFPFTLGSSRNMIYLTFPGKRHFLMKQIVGVAATAFLFIVLLGAAFVLIITMMFRQKRFSQSLVEFINNMTHEFKTPISTISLVSENMSKPEVLNDKKRLARYSRVIRDENMRMRGQVNKILQMAELEQGEIRLKQDRIDMHDLITTVADHFTIQAENSNGTVTLSLAADRCTVSGDRDHLINIFNNLLDNGLKYNAHAPQLNISTQNSGAALTVRIEDNGIGIAPEHIRRIFDKYYRVPTGNLHDVKGFGLGLSYVKLMVEAHRGSISVSSHPDRGTVFTITLPVIQDE